MKRLVLGLAVLVAALTTASPSAVADASFPYGDRVTAHVADRLHGTHRGGWLATTLDINGFRGWRKAEEVKIPAGHGRRWVGIIHVKPGHAGAAQRALSDVWIAQNGTVLVVPLRSNDWTDGGSGASYKQAATWVKHRLGGAWRVR